MIGIFDGGNTSWDARMTGDKRKCVIKRCFRGVRSRLDEEMRDLIILSVCVSVFFIEGRSRVIDLG